MPDPDVVSPNAQLLVLIVPSESVAVDVKLAVRFETVDVNDATGGTFGAGSVTVTSWVIESVPPRLSVTVSVTG